MKVPSGGTIIFKQAIISEFDLHSQNISKSIVG